MSDLNEVWNINRTPMETTSLSNSSFPRNQLGPSYAPYTQEEVSGVYNEEQRPYQPKNIYSTTLGMAPAIVTPEYIRNLFTNEYFLQLLGEFMISNNMVKEGFTSCMNIKFDIMHIILGILSLLLFIIILFKVK